MEHEKRMLNVTILFLLSYLCLAVTMYWQDYDIALPFGYVALIVHQIARSLGEASFIGYLKAVPQELIVSFGSGTGVADFFGIVTALILSEFGMARSPYLLFLALLMFPYYMSFLWIENYRLKHK